MGTKLFLPIMYQSIIPTIVSYYTPQYPSYLCKFLCFGKQETAVNAHIPHLLLRERSTLVVASLCRSHKLLLTHLELGGKTVECQFNPIQLPAYKKFVNIP